MTEEPTHRVDGQLPAVPIGDSTMLLSVPGLAAAGYVVNAHGCREFYQGLQLLQQLKAAGQLPHMVVMALGANGCMSRQNISQALSILSADRLLVLVTPRQLGTSSRANTVIGHQEVRAYPGPGRILLLDWVADSAGHPDWFQPYGLHLTWSGLAAFKDLLDTALSYAYVPPGLLDRPSATGPTTAGAQVFTSPRGLWKESSRATSN